MTRPSDLSASAFRRLYNAVWNAQLLGTPLNVWGTFAWHLEFGMDQSAACRALAQYFKCSGQWLADQGHPDRAHLWVDENPDGRFHTHFLQHVPPVLAERFRSWIDRYCRRTFNRGHADGGLLQREIRTTPSTFSEFAKLSYMCKGHDREEMLFRTAGSGEPVRLGDIIRDHYADPGVIEGRRYGIARLLHKRQLARAYAEALAAAPAARFVSAEDCRSALDRQFKCRMLDGDALYPSVIDPMFEPRRLAGATERRHDKAVVLLQALRDRDVRSVLDKL